MSTDAVLDLVENGVSKTQPLAYSVLSDVAEYTWPSEPMLHALRFVEHENESYLRLELTDGRNLEIPLWWIPTLRNAELEQREKYYISRDRKLIVWDPLETGTTINEIIRIADYLRPWRTE